MRKIDDMLFIKIMLGFIVLSTAIYTCMIVDSFLQMRDEIKIICKK